MKMLKFLLLTVFLIVVLVPSCQKSDDKPSCASIEARLEDMEKALRTIAAQVSANLITVGQGNKRIKDINKEVAVLVEQLKDCE